MTYTSQIAKCHIFHESKEFFQVIVKKYSFIVRLENELFQKPINSHFEYFGQFCSRFHQQITACILQENIKHYNSGH